MRWELPSGQRPGTTRRVFLWLPRFIEGHFVWLEHVDRFMSCDRLAPTNCGYDYRLIY